LVENIYSNGLLYCHIVAALIHEVLTQADRVATVFVLVVSARVLVVVARERQLNLRKNKQNVRGRNGCVHSTHCSWI